MISSQRAYVWIWLPGQTSPVVAGLVERDDQDRYRFAYGRRYLAREDAISLYPDELPLRSGRQDQVGGALPSCLRDAAPDAWGRRVLTILLSLKEEDSRVVAFPVPASPPVALGDDTAGLTQAPQA